ncbi:MAG: Hsp70 family protein [Candidatus Bathyarchaeia archaeon]
MRELIINRNQLSQRKNSLVIGIDFGTTNSVMAIAGMELKDNPNFVKDNPNERETSFPDFIPVKVLQLPQEFPDGTIVSHYLFPSVVFQETPNSRFFAGMGASEAKYFYAKGRQVFYSIKMDLGKDLDPHYPAAVTPDLNTPVKVASKILSTMREAAENLLNISLKNTPTVITVPASFQSPQRRDIIRAAEMAGFPVDEQNLFDEPNAALLAYMNRRRVQYRWNTDETVLIFDFGGGTCDISIIEVSLSPVRNAITLKNLALSRFEQLGGDDIDKHLVHEWLKDIFYKTTGTKERDWSYAERKGRIWSQLSKVAELMKIRFCKELEVVSQLSSWDEKKISKIQVTIPPQTIQTSIGPIVLNNLELNWDIFHSLLEPFLDPSCSKEADKEFYRITSIFSPIKDALNKAMLMPKDITRILLVGGSSKNPLVEKAIQNFFPEASIERPSDMEYLVAEGAAVHAFMHFVLGHDILKPIVGDTIGMIVEENQFVPLVPAGSTIPFPDDYGWMKYEQFKVPRDGMDHVDLIFCAGNISRPIHNVRLDFNQEIPKNTPLTLMIRLDQNKVFGIEAFLPCYPDIKVKENIENPLGLLPMTSTERKRAELEKKLNKAKETNTLDQHIQDMESLSETLLQLNHVEQSIAWINEVIKRTRNPTSRIIEKKAYAHWILGEIEEAHELYKELSRKSPLSITYAIDAGLTAPNLDIMEHYIKKAVEIAPNDGICQFFYAQVLEKRGRVTESKKALQRSRELLEEMVKNFPNRLYYLSYLKDVYYLLGEQNQASRIENKIEEIKQKQVDNIVDVSSVPGLNTLPG